MIVALKTDAPEATVALIDGQERINSHSWHAHKTLARDLLSVIKERLQTQQKDWPDISGVILFKGPGSFTGLRIGATVANTIAHTNQLPIVGTEGAQWLTDGSWRLKNGEDDRFVQPFYGREATITTPRK